MRKERDTDHLTLALGLLGATLLAGIMALLMPGFIEGLSAPEALPQPDIITQYRGPIFDEGPPDARLPQAEPPPAYLLNLESAVQSTVALNN
jgi:hypothetical protein